MSVLQTDTQLLLTQLFVNIVIRYVQCKEMCFNPHVGHLQASILYKINYFACEKLQVYSGDFYVRHPSCVLFID